MEARGKRRVSITPIDPSQLLFNLRLSTGKAAEFCHISRRQLCYWTDKVIYGARVWVARGEHKGRWHHSQRKAEKDTHLK